MDADAFHALYDEVVPAGLAPLGFTGPGKRLVYQDDDVQAALARVEHRGRPPAEVVLLYRHRFLRDRSEVVPAKPPREPLDYPIAAPPSTLAAVAAGHWTYKPGRGTGMADVVDYPKLDEPAARALLTGMAAAVVAAWPSLAERWSPAVLQATLAVRGDAMWRSERLWLDDYEARVTPNG